MRILMVSDLETLGGAAIAASRLADALVAAGCSVSRLVVAADADDETHAWETLDPQKLRGYLGRTSLKLLNHSRKILGPNHLAIGWRIQAQSLLAAAIDQVRPDVVNFHNLHVARSDGWGVETVAAAAERVPTVWTLHDMWSFTGRCAYSYNCRKFLSGCDASCPTPNEYPALAPHRINPVWHAKGVALAASPRLVAVSPSRWLATEAKAGMWADNRVEVIPYGLPLDDYRPITRTIARAALDIPDGAPVLLTVASNLSERRKGGAFMADAMRQLRPRPFTLVALGGGKLPVNPLDRRVIELGHIDHARTLALVYSAADFLIHPAPVDNLPHVVMEAMACGTPTVAYPIGGLPDMVRPGITGYLAGSVSPEALAVAIDEALNGLEAGIGLRTSSREIAMREYGADLQAERYLDLFRSLVGGCVPIAQTVNATQQSAKP